MSKAVASQDSLAGVRDAVVALDEISVKSALIAAAIERHSREVSRGNTSIGYCAPAVASTWTSSISPEHVFARRSGAS